MYTQRLFSVRIGFVLAVSFPIALFSSFLSISDGGIACWAQGQAQAPTETSQPQPAPRGAVPAQRDLYRQQLLLKEKKSALPGEAEPPGQPSPQAQMAPADRQPPAVQPAIAQQPPGAAASPHRAMFTLNFDDADVYTIIQTIFGDVLKANYVVDPRVKGRVTFRAVAPVPVESVLPLMEVILRLNGIGIVEENGLYRILPISDVSKEPAPISIGRDPAAIPMTGKALVQVVPILYIPSSDALKLITPFATNNAVLIDVPKGNQIIIVDTDANVKRLLKLVEVFDNQNLQRKKPQVFVYPVQNGVAKDVASLLQQIFLGGKGSTQDRNSAPPRAGMGSQTVPPSSAAGPVPSSPSPAGAAVTGGEMLVGESTRIIADEITNTIVIMSTPEDYAAIAKAIEQIDIVPRQVIIEAMVAQVLLTDNLSLGLAALFKGSASSTDFSIGVNPGGLLNVNPAALTQAGFTFLATDAAGVVRALLSALASESKAKVLAAPHILVSDNRDARIQVGQQVPLIASETYGSTTVAPQRNFQYRDIGIILKVKPRINEGGLVSLELAQEISTFAKINVGGSDQILLNKTEASTNLVVQDGQTIVIGGLIREDTVNSATGVPFLSRIPIIGWLFGGTMEGKERQELIILLTPRVIKSQKEAKDLSSQFIDRISESTGGRIRGEEILKVQPQGPQGDIILKEVPREPQGESILQERPREQGGEGNK